MTFTRFVEVGRVALINYGDDCGKLCTIIEVVDQNKVLVDGPAPETGIQRQVISLRRLNLTDIKVNIGRHAREKTIKAAWAKEEVSKKFSESAWGKTLARKSLRANLGDFGRFKVMVARKNKSKIVAKKLAELKN